MNTEYLIDEKNQHVILMSKGPHLFSFKQYFVRKVLCLNESELSDNVFQSDRLLTSFLKDNDYMGKFSMDDYESAEFVSIRVNDSHNVFKKNQNTYKNLDTETINKRHNFLNFNDKNRLILNNFRITCIIQNPYERIVFYFLTKYYTSELSLNTKFVYEADELLSFLGISRDNLTISNFITSLLKKLPINHNRDLLDFCEKQTIDDDLIFEKLTNLSNFLLITDNHIDIIFPGYNEFINEDKVIEGLTTWERLSCIMGVTDLYNSNLCYLTKNLLRTGSFNLHKNKLFKKIFETDIKLYYKTKQYLDENYEPYQFIVFGCVRSGTTFVNRLFRDFSNSNKNPVEYIYFNEDLRFGINNRWSLRTKNFISKQCEDVNNIRHLKRIFPYLKFFYVIRDLRDVIYTLTYPSNKSWPPRKQDDFPRIAEIKKEEKCSIISAVIKFIEHDYSPSKNTLEKFKSDIFIVKYEDLLTPSGLLSFLNKYLPLMGVPVVNMNFPQKGIEKLIKPVNYNGWLKFDSTEMKLLFSHKFVQEFLDKYEYMEKNSQQYYLEKINYQEGLLKGIDLD